MSVSIRLQLWIFLFTLHLGTKLGKPNGRSARSQPRVKALRCWSPLSITSAASLTPPEDIEKLHQNSVRIFTYVGQQGQFRYHLSRSPWGGTPRVGSGAHYIPGVRQFMNGCRHREVRGKLSMHRGRSSGPRNPSALEEARTPTSEKQQNKCQ